MVRLENLVSKDHPYSTYIKLLDFRFLHKKLLPLEVEDRYKGYGIIRLFKCISLQFMEDLSDRQLKKFLQENTAGKWYCDFYLKETTPDYTVLSKMRSRPGTTLLSKKLAKIKKQHKKQGYKREIFSIEDASHIVYKVNIWQKRDKSIEKKRNYLIIRPYPSVAHDKQAKIRCKGKNKIKYSYKKQVSVDMQRSLINKVTITPANVTKAQRLPHVLPKSGAVYADKRYGEPAQLLATSRGVHLAAIKKRKKKDKNVDLDNYNSKLRKPYERVFAHQNRRVRYVGIAKNQFSEFMNALCFNLKQLSVLGPPSLAC